MAMMKNKMLDKQCWTTSTKSSTNRWWLDSWFPQFLATCQSIPGQDAEPRNLLQQPVHKNFLKRIDKVTIIIIIIAIIIIIIIIINNTNEGKLRITKMMLMMEMGDDDEDDESHMIKETNDG